MSDAAFPLPAHPSLEPLRKRAKELLRDFRAGDSAASHRFLAIIPRLADPALSVHVMLADAQFVLAREYGFASWAKLVQHIEAMPAKDLEQHERLAQDL